MVQAKFNEHKFKAIVIQFAYIIAPASLVAVYSFATLLVFKCGFSVKPNVVSSIVNISGVFAGFLLTASSIMYGLPENKFTLALMKSGYFNRVLKTMLLGTIVFLITTFLGLLVSNALVSITVLFLIGFAETFLSTFYLFRIIQFSSKSK